MKKDLGKKPVRGANRDLLRRAGATADQIASAPDFYQSVAELLHATRTKAYRAVNFAMVEAYWNVGRMIVEEEQRGKGRAEYGAALIKNLSSRLTEEFGKGFTETNLKYFRQFYLAFPMETPSAIRHTLCDRLTWSHYRLLMRVEKPEARRWYLSEAVDQNWSVRALERQIHTLYYERLLIQQPDFQTARKYWNKLRTAAKGRQSVGDKLSPTETSQPTGDILSPLTYQPVTFCNRLICKRPEITPQVRSNPWMTQLNADGETSWKGKIVSKRNLLANTLLWPKKQPVFVDIAGVYAHAALCVLHDFVYALRLSAPCEYARSPIPSVCRKPGAFFFGR